MKTRICLMGDSQAAALKKGWTRTAERFPGTEITFFAGSSFDWTSLHVAGGRLVPGTERLRAEFARSARGSEEIGAGFDAYVLCGLGLAISFPLRLWTHHGHADWSAYRAAVAEHVRATRLAHVLARLREITQARALVLAGPHQPHDFCKSSPLLDAAAALKLRANFLHQCEALAEAHKARFLAQPEETLAPNGITTQMCFANISKNPEHEDRRHCNAAYGEIAMRHVLQSGLGIRPIAD